MSSKIVVTEGNDVKIINDVSKLVTRLSNGETCNWVQEDSVRLVTKTIIKDGIYIASNDVGSPYGYSQVSVNGVGNKILGQLGEKSITKNGTYEADKDKDGPYYGYSTIVVNVEGGESGDGGGTSRPVVPGKDSDGDDAVGTVDDDGNIVVEKLPSEIKVIVTPDNLEYEDGQSIVFDGLLVKAYYPDGTEYDSIPTTDLIRPVRVAEYDESAIENIHHTDYGDYVLSLDSYNNDGTIRYSNIHVENGILIPYNYTQNTQNDTSTCMVAACSLQESTLIATFHISGGEPRTTTWTVNAPIKVGNFTGYTIGISFNNVNPRINYPSVDKYIDIFREWANESSQSSSSASSQQVIPLQWKRPGDKKVLETSFTITVHASDDSGSGSGGSGGGSGPQPQPTPPPS